MELKFVEAGHPVDETTGFGGNWGKFSIGRWSTGELGEPTRFPGCEGQKITNLNGRGLDHIWVFDLQTGEGARFSINNPVPVDVRDQLNKHQIWVCPMFEPFLTAVWAHISEYRREWWDRLPRTIELPDAPFDMHGYRRSGPDNWLAEANADILQSLDVAVDTEKNLLDVKRRASKQDDSGHPVTDH